MHQDGRMSTGKRTMWTYIAGLQMFDIGPLGLHSVSGWCCRHSVRQLCWVWNRLCMSGGCSWTGVVPPPLGLTNLTTSIWTMTICIGVVLMNHSWVSLYRSHHLFVPRELVFLLLLILDFGAMYLVRVLCCLYCGMQNSALSILAISMPKCI